VKKVHLNDNKKSIGESLIKNRGINPKNFLPYLQECFILALPGILVMLFIIPIGRVINPFSNRWLMSGDPSQAYIGWEYFRHSPLNQFPLGLIPNLGVNLDISVVYTDSIPLLAIPFKFLNPILPIAFQYFGIWISMCFILISYHSGRIFQMYTNSKYKTFLGSSLVAISPVLVFRMNWGHLALLAHFLILMAVRYILSANFNPRKWLILVVISIFIHAYFFIMILTIFLIDLILKFQLHKVSIREILKSFCTVLVSSFLSMLVIGYFTVRSSIKSEGYGIYRFNLISPISPLSGWSKLLNEQSIGPGDYEGFAFLGLGSIFLLTIILPNVLRKRSYPRSFLVVFGFAVFSILVSATNQIAFGSINLFSYSFPGFTEGTIGLFNESFRSSGRFIWPLYYVGLILIIRKSFEIKASVNLLFIALILQLVDGNTAYSEFRKKVEVQSLWTSTLEQPELRKLTKEIRKVLFYPVKNYPDFWQEVQYVTSRENIPVNAGYFARWNENARREMDFDLRSDLLRGSFLKNSLYIINDQEIYDDVCSQQFAKIRCLTVNSIRIIVSNES
jgi:hypothetical protein